VLLRVVTVGAAVLALAGCGGGGGSEEAATTTAVPTSSQLSPGCEVAVADEAITGFFDAVSSGDRARIRARLSPPDDFERLTVADSDGSTFTTTSRTKALDWLVGRHAFDERLRLLSMQVAPGIDANHDAVAGAASRVASDFPKRGITNRLYDFEGTIACLRGSISRLQLQGAG